MDVKRALTVRAFLRNKTIQTEADQNQERTRCVPKKNYSLVKKANEDFRDVVSQAEYPRASKYGFDEPSEKELKTDYLNDWNEYVEWKNKRK